MNSRSGFMMNNGSSFIVKRDKHVSKSHANVAILASRESEPGLRKRDIDKINKVAKELGKQSKAKR